MKFLSNVMIFKRRSQPKEIDNRTTSHKIDSDTDSTNSVLLNDRFLDGTTIIKDEKIAALIVKLRDASDVPDDYFDDYYLPVIVNVASYCQSASASKDYHHTYAFGLFIHLLETALYSVRARSQYYYAPTKVEEDIDNYKHVYCFAVFVAAMHHDLGKIITDIRFFIRQDKNQQYVAWNPLSSYPPSEDMNIEYKIQRKFSKKQKKPLYIYNSHNIAAISLLSRTLTKDGLEWITSYYPLLETHLYHAIAGDFDNADVIGKSVLLGDQTSTELGSNNVMDISLGDEQGLGGIKRIILDIFRDPLPSSLTVNSTKFSQIVRIENKIFVSGIALIKAIRPQAQRLKISLPENNKALETLICDHFTLPSPSGDTMWWVKFTKKGQPADIKKKDIKCFAFDAGIFLTEDTIPVADQIDVHLGSKTRDDEDSIGKSNGNSNQTSDKVMGIEGMSMPDKDFLKGNPLGSLLDSLSNGSPLTSNVTADKLPGTENKLDLTNIPVQQSTVTGKETVDNQNQQLSNTNNHGSDLATPDELPKEKKEEVKMVKGTDLLAMLDNGKNGHMLPEQKQVNEPNKPQEPKKPQKPKKSQEHQEHQEPKVKETEVESKKKVDQRLPSSSFTALLPSAEDINEMFKKDASKDIESKPELPTENNEHLHKQTSNAPEPINEPDSKEISKNSVSPKTLDLVAMANPEIDPTWMEMDYDDFVAAQAGTLVSFFNEAPIVKDDTLQLEQVSAESRKDSDYINKLKESIGSVPCPEWALPVTPKEKDDDFIIELFGVLQQAINSGLKFNRIGSKLFVVHNGIFLPSPAAFNDLDFPLSTRPDYYKNLIKNSSYLARKSNFDNGNLITGRVVQTQLKGPKVRLKTKAFLNGFYLITNHKVQLTYNTKVIKPSKNIVFDHKTVNRIIEL